MQPLISTLPLLKMASGDTLELQLYRFVGGTAGKKVYLQANLHGAEIAGNSLIYQLITWLSQLAPAQLSGEIWLVPVCNPIGVNTRSHHFASGRYNPYDGRDWNRIFWQYDPEPAALTTFAQAYLTAEPAAIAAAYRQLMLQAFADHRAAQSAPAAAPTTVLYSSALQALALDADYLIDLHTSGDRGLTYLYYFPQRAAAAAQFGLTFGILLDRYDGDAFDEAFIRPWLALEEAFSALGRPLRFEVEAYTLELGAAMQSEPAAIRQGLQGVQHYLAQKGLLDRALLPSLSLAPPAEMILTRASQLKKYYAPTGGFLQSRVEPGTWVQPGVPLYSLLSFNKVGQLPQLTAVEAETAALVYDVSLNQAFSQGEYVLAVLQPDA